MQKVNYGTYKQSKNFFFLLLENRPDPVRPHRIRRIRGWSLLLWSRSAKPASITSLSRSGHHVLQSLVSLLKKTTTQLFLCSPKRGYPPLPWHQPTQMEEGRRGRGGIPYGHDIQKNPPPLGFSLSLEKKKQNKTKKTHTTPHLAFALQSLWSTWFPRKPTTTHLASPFFPYTAFKVIHPIAHFCSLFPVFWHFFWQPS